MQCHNWQKYEVRTDETDNSPRSCSLTCDGIQLRKTTPLKSATPGQKIDLSGYSIVVVLDFEDSTSLKSKKAKRIRRHQEDMEIAKKLLADQIAVEIRTAELFDEVTRDPTTEDALVISGAITRYQKGDAAARLMIGLGAGSSYFDAKVQLRDNKTGSEIGSMKLDKQSWALGGSIAATQSVEGFMKGAARKLTKELSRIREGH